MASPYPNTVLPLDANGRPFSGMLPFRAKKTITFAGGTTNAIGDHDGTGDPFTIFTVTGDVLVWVLGIVKTTLVGSATIEVGTAGATAAILAQVSDATTLAVNEGWWDTSPTLAERWTPQFSAIGGGLDIIGTLGSANVTAGVIDFYCFWMPLSDDGYVVGD